MPCIPDRFRKLIHLPKKEQAEVSSNQPPSPILPLTRDQGLSRRTSVEPNSEAVSPDVLQTIATYVTFWDSLVLHSSSRAARNLSTFTQKDEQWAGPFRTHHFAVIETPSGELHASPISKLENKKHRIVGLTVSPDLSSEGYIDPRASFSFNLTHGSIPVIDPLTGNDIFDIAIEYNSIHDRQLYNKPHHIKITVTEVNPNDHSDVLLYTVSYDTKKLIAHRGGGRYKQLTDEHALVLMQAVDAFMRASLEEAPRLTGPKQTEQTIIKETIGTSWTYKELQQRLIQIVTKSEIPFKEIPTGNVDFGQLALELYGLLRATEHTELEKTIGVALNTLVFSPRNTDGSEWNVTGRGYGSFDEATKQLLDGLAAMIHTHTNRLLVTGSDLDPLRTLEGKFPLAGIGIPSMYGKQGCLVFAIRSSDTEKLPRDSENNVETVISRMEELSDQRLNRYTTSLYYEELRAHGKTHAGELTEAEVNEINTGRDVMIREIAEENHIALFIVALGETVGHRVDLSKPILDQIPPKTVKE